VKPYERKVQYYETDKMGIVHHSNYIRWFEEARIDYMEQAGAGYQEMEEEGIISPVLEVSCKYKTMARFPERFQIKVKMLEFNGIRMRLGYEVKDAETGEVRCIGETAHCFLDGNYRPISLKKSFPEWYQILQKEL
jgi:acyl-CoA thioester hydrolase